MLKKAYFEITNACNLSCSFCHGTKRDIKFVTREEFTRAASEIRPYAEYLYFHLMGEPLLHPELASFFDISNKLGFKVILTTNGTMLCEKQDILLSAKNLHKVSISLHCYEANEVCESIEDYLSGCFEFASKASSIGIICVMRLWNIGANAKLNEKIISLMHDFFDIDRKSEWKETYSGYKIRDKVFLEWGERFEWPDIDGEDYGSSHTCYGLRDQIGVLSDGTVVPCCLDAEGVINLGNIYTESLSDILSSDRAVKLRVGLQNRCVTEELCKRCGYAHMKKY